MQAYSEIIVREKEYEPRYFIRVRMLIVWRGERDSNPRYLLQYYALSRGAS